MDQRLKEFSERIHGRGLDCFSFHSKENVLMVWDGDFIHPLFRSTGALTLIGILRMRKSYSIQLDSTQVLSSLAGSSAL